MIDSAQPTKRRSGVYKLILEQHGAAFASVKRLGMRSDEPPQSEPAPRTERLLPPERVEMVEVSAALKAVVQTELSLGNDTDGSDLADVVAALDAINPGSPEWGPTFLQLSELVEARVNEDDELLPASDDAFFPAAG